MTSPNISSPQQGKHTVITHITPHIGVGIGKAITSLIIGSQRKNPDYHHEILLLEKPLNTFFNEKCERYKIPVIVAEDKESRNEAITSSDLVQVEWWHHPLTYQFLYDLPKTPMRMMMWYHVNGCHHPYLKPETVDIPSAFVLTGEYTCENNYWSEPQRQHVKDVCPVINSSCGFKGLDAPKTPHDGFTVGFLGTLDYAKINPNFLDYLYSVADTPGIRFRIVGEGPELENMRAWASGKEYGYKFTFTGFVPDISAELAQFDVCAQILNTEPYDTAQLSLQENMAMGVPAIVLNQASEKYIITNDEVGVKVRNISEFREAVLSLRASKERRETIGNAARAYIREKFSCDNLIGKMHPVYASVLEKPAKVVDFKPLIGGTPGDWFVSSVAPGRDVLHKAIMKGENKLSLRQWMRYYPDDKQLRMMVV